MNIILKQWAIVVDHIRGAKCSKQLLDEFTAINTSLRRTAANWNSDRNYRGYINRIAERSKKFISDWNSQHGGGGTA